MKFKSWYLKLLIVWGLLALPGFLLGLGFSGGSIWETLSASFDPEFMSPLDMAATAVAWIAFLSPVLLAPAGLERQ